MNNPTDAAEILRDLALAATGVWAAIRFRKERTYEAALEIRFNATVVSVGSLTTTFLEVTLINLGRSMLQARPVPERGFVFNDGIEQVRFAGDLKLKRLDPASPGTDVHLDWFSSKSLTDVCEINLLSEYENFQGKRIEFWMEPGEVYRLGVPLNLEPGIYLAKITFVGANKTEDFWSRITAFEVKQQAEQ